VVFFGETAVNAPSVLAARKKNGEDVQVGVCEQPAFGLFSGGFGGAHNRAEMSAAGHAVKMLDADSREAGNFFVGKKFLTRFNGDHLVSCLFSAGSTLQLHGGVQRRVRARIGIPSNRPSVSLASRFRISGKLQMDKIKGFSRGMTLKNILRMARA
jgi:hypothetical protein